MRRIGTACILLVAMGGFGFGVYAGLGHLRKVDAGGTGTSASSPDHATARITLPGTLFVAQAGSLYRMHNGAFTKLSLNGLAYVTQPSVTADGTHLLVVSRQAEFSDVYLVGLDGTVITQLTHNQAPPKSTDVSDNHWSFTPRQASDGTIFTSDDRPKNGYEVDLAIWTRPMQGAATPSTQWSVPNSYTGGDLDPIPLTGGGILYTKFAIDGSGQVFSQIWMQSAPMTNGIALTTQADDCSEPALSSDQSEIAMVCSHGQQTTDLVTAHLAGTTIGPVKTIVSNQYCASPAWSPDGTGLVYVKPSTVGSPFQLWWARNVEGKSPKLTQVTTNVALDATSAPAWIP